MTITNRTVTSEQFVRDLDGREIDVSEAGSDERLQGVDLAGADLTGDGKISGPDETLALFKKIDNFDSNGDRRSVRVSEENGRAVGLVAPKMAAIKDRARLVTRSTTPNSASGAGTSSGTSTGSTAAVSGASVSGTTGAGTTGASVSGTTGTDATSVSGTTGSSAPLPGIFDEASARKLAEGGKSSIETRTAAHLNAIDRTGIGLYYGDHSTFGSMSSADQKAWIASHKKAGTSPSSPSQNSCIGWAMENVKAAYVAAGKAERWAEIQRIVVAKGSKGTDLAIELKKDGWEAVYFNPDTKKPDDGNAEHTYTARLVSQGKPYYGIKVDHQVTNYRRTDASSPTDMSGIEKLRKAPFFFGLARGGVHTFVGSQGKVSEFHWAEMPDSRRAIETTPLEGFGWNSGIVMVPPGTWPSATAQ